MRRPVVALSAACAAAILVSAAADPLPRATPESVGLSSAKLTEATELLDRFVAEGKIAGAVAAVARKGRLASLHAAGYQNLASKTPMTGESIFRIYSMSKAITAVAAMMLHDQGRFALTDPVAKFIPEFKSVRVAAADGTTRPPSRDITVQDLLLHTSGLEHRTSDLYRKEQVRTRSMTMAQFIANLVRVPLMEDPGTRFRYSESTTVLGRLVEIWSGQPFETYLETQLFTPLKMIDTRFWTTPEQRPRLTTVYQYKQGAPLVATDTETVPFTERPGLIEGAVGLLSTVPDFLRFSQMLLNKGELDGARVLKRETAERMVGNGLPDAVLKARGGGAVGWGLANVNVVMTVSPNNPANVGEYTWDGTAGTIFWVDPAAELITILMTQSVPSNPDRIRQQFKALVQQAVR